MPLPSDVLRIRFFKEFLYLVTNFIFYFMKKLQIITLLLVVTVPWILNTSCKKQKQQYKTDAFEVSLPRLKLKHDLYYSISYLDRSIEMEFNEPLDYESVAGNILFSDKSGALDGYVDLQVSGRQVMLLFKEDFELRNGWQYFLTIKTGLKSESGLQFSYGKKIELRTSASHPDLAGGGANPDTSRISVAVISDIHMGDHRANELKYCWFGKNNTALLELLDFFYSGNQVRQIVILGDLFDEWIVPYTISPFDPQAGIFNSEDYFHAVANNPVNQPVIAKLQQIAASQEIDLIYVHGNHDMLLTSDVLQSIIPGIIWMSDTIGLGRYTPVPEIILEHGHRYDFFNCPQPLTNPGHMLPPGYFVSRLYAQGTMEHPGLLKGGAEATGSFEFLAAWEVAYNYTILNLKMTAPDPDEKNILMGGIDNYPGPFSFNGIRDMYAASIEDLWNQTQIHNNVPYPMACCFHAIWNGHSDLYTAAKMQYLDPAFAPKTYKIVGFGHTHEAMLEVYPNGPAYKSIYANSGTWIDKDQCSYHVRTYLVITPGAWSGSDIDIVGLYQYNLDSNSGNQGSGYSPLLLAEESIPSGTN